MLSITLHFKRKKLDLFGEHICLGCVIKIKNGFIDTILDPFLSIIGLLFRCNDDFHLPVKKGWYF